MAKNIDTYIAGFPEEIQNLLQQIRTAIHEAVPQAQEVISYQMPAFYLEGILVYFAAFKNHIGFYPTFSGIRAFQDRLQIYEGSKGAVRFPFDKPLPLDLICDMVKFRVNENLEHAKMKR